MTDFINNLEDRAARRFGLEARRTIRVFRFTAILRKLFRIHD